MAKKPFDPFAEKRRPGAPTTYTPELATEVCRRLILGRSLRDICNDADMPHRDTVFLWLATHPEFSDQYVRAREEQADTHADDAHHVTILVAAGKIDPNAGRVAVDGLKWSAAMQKPKKYGKVTTTRHSGEDGGAIPLRFESLSDAQLGQFIDRLADFAARADRAGGGEGGTGPPPEGEDQ
ncbi:MAG TPA: hypothetical protein VGJ79_00670 [Candidatus Dormibacteraeota bacterium]|jgi:hypothetical protein